MLKHFRVRSRIVAFFVGIILPVVLFGGCSVNRATNQSLLSPPSPPAATQVAQVDLSIPTKLAKAIVAACPLTDPGAQEAQSQCAEKLAKLELLRDSMAPEIRWGGQKEASNFVLKDNPTTSFDPLVWRRLYLSTYMFSGEPKVEQQNNLTLIRLPVQFRDQLSAGAFPYPFWHSKKKWAAYKQSKEVVLIMEDGKIRGALRSAEKDKTRVVNERKWDGQWSWAGEGKQEPSATLYQALFSPENPHVQTLDAAYREFEKEMRPYSCLACHSPNNASKMNPLLLLNYPNQALTLRHETVRQIEEKLMPPEGGIVNNQERQRLVKLAATFAKTADQALAFEGERVTPEKTASNPSSRGI
jgi:hypothetical protein